MLNDDGEEIDHEEFSYELAISWFPTTKRLLAFWESPCHATGLELARCLLCCAVAGISPLLIADQVGFPWAYLPGESMYSLVR